MIKMNVTTMLVAILLICIIVFVIFLTVAIKNLINTIKKTNEILEDTEIVTSIISGKVEDSEDVLEQLMNGLRSIAKALGGNETLSKSMANVTKAISSLISLIKRNKK